MSASKGLSISVRLSWQQHLPTHDIEPSSPTPCSVRAELLPGSESLGMWHWGDGSYQPGASNWQGPGEPQMETHSLVSFTGPGLIFMFPNHEQTCGATVGAWGHTRRWGSQGGPGFPVQLPDLLWNPWVLRLRQSPPPMFLAVPQPSNSSSPKFTAHVAMGFTVFSYPKLLPSSWVTAACFGRPQPGQLYFCALVASWFFFSLFSLAIKLPLLTVAMVPASSCSSSWSVQEPSALGVTLSWIRGPSLLLTVCVMVGKWLKLCKPPFPPLWHGYDKEGSLRVLL